MEDNPRLEDLRRRVQEDPASIAFAQLAEEYRRAGWHREAVETCRTGLAKHPNYLSARVTLGRALLELGELQGAVDEFETVLRHAPENLTAIRCLGETHQRQGEPEAALARFQDAYRLASNDPELEEIVANLSRQLSAAAPREEAGENAGEKAGDEAPEVAMPHVLTGEPPALADEARARALAVLATLEGWLAAIHVTRTQRHP